MTKRLKNRIMRRLGFTLAETLLTVLILGIATSLVAAGIPLALNIYNRLVDTANAQVMMSTAMTLLRDEVGMSYDVTVADDGTTITYTSGRSGGRCQITSPSNGTLQIKEVYGYDIENDPNALEPRDMVYATNGRLRVTYESVAYYGEKTNVQVNDKWQECPAGTFVFKNVEVWRSGDAEPLATVKEYVICTIRAGGA